MNSADNNGPTAPDEQALADAVNAELEALGEDALGDAEAGEAESFALAGTERSDELVAEQALLRLLTAGEPSESVRRGRGRALQGLAGTKTSSWLDGFRWWGPAMVSACGALLWWGLEPVSRAPQATTAHSSPIPPPSDALLRAQLDLVRGGSQAQAPYEQAMRAYRYSVLAQLEIR